MYIRYMPPKIDMFEYSKNEIEEKIVEIEKAEEKNKYRLKGELNRLISSFNIIYPDYDKMYTPVILEKIDYYGNIKPGANDPGRYKGGKSRRMKKSRRRTKKSRRRVRIYL